MTILKKKKKLKFLLRRNKRILAWMMKMPMFYKNHLQKKFHMKKRDMPLNLLDKAKSNIMGLQKNLDNLKERNSRRHKGPFTKELSILKDNIKKLVRIVEKSNIPQT